jgi:hypothetical protein
MTAMMMIMTRLMRVATTAAIAASAASAAVPRAVRVDGQQFVLAETNASVVLAGPNVVVKGPPYLPSVSGSTICNDVVNDECKALGNCSSCTTFNAADVAHLKANGWNSIRLGVVWAGAQPRDEDRLDPAFLERLHALLDLTDREGIAVVLDNHGDAVGSANCGNGVPMWFSQKASPVRCLGAHSINRASCRHHRAHPASPR